MKELLMNVKGMYERDEEVKGVEEKIVYEFVGLFQLDEDLSFEEAVDVLIDCLYANE